MFRPLATTSGAVSVATSSTPVVAANANRRELTVTNDGANIIYLQLQTVANTAPTAVASQGVRLAASGGSWTTFSHTGAVAGIALTGATVVTVVDI